jgi:CheY-like chemotaxis protein
VGETVLVAEDDPAVRKLIEHVLARAGYAVLVASTPEDALALANMHDGPIDLLVTDMIMPGMTGPALAEGVIAERPGIPVLFNSGYSGEDIVRRGLDTDLPFIEKPFTPGALIDKVQQLLRDASGDAPHS